MISRCSAKEVTMWKLGLWVQNSVVAGFWDFWIFFDIFPWQLVTPRKRISLTADSFSCRFINLVYVHIFLDGWQSRKTSLRASRQGNSIFLAIQPWRFMLDGWPPITISLAVFLYSLAVFGRQGNSFPSHIDIWWGTHHHPWWYIDESLHVNWMLVCQAPSNHPVDKRRRCDQQPCSHKRTGMWNGSRNLGPDRAALGRVGWPPPQLPAV